ncbi:MAG: hypothetical protein DBX55_05915 [Verrucomicrobia bacterium]|nr:MAG: hypothetical protein DBX55_05915 [Verrucomicrobiota bacterium]
MKFGKILTEAFGGNLARVSLEFDGAFWNAEYGMRDTGSVQYVFALERLRLERLREIRGD